MSAQLGRAVNLQQGKLNLKISTSWQVYIKVTEKRTPKNHLVSFFVLFYL